jgi:hypothetical protein
LFIIEAADADRWCWYWSPMLVLIIDADIIIDAYADHWCWSWSFVLLLIIDASADPLSHDALLWFLTRLLYSSGWLLAFFWLWMWLYSPQTLHSWRHNIPGLSWEDDGDTGRRIILCLILTGCPR